MPRPLDVDWQRIRSQFVGGFARKAIVESNPSLTLAALERRASREGWVDRKLSLNSAPSARPMPGGSEETESGQTAPDIEEARRTGQTGDDRTDNDRRELVKRSLPRTFQDAREAVQNGDFLTAGQAAVRAAVEMHLDALEEIATGDFRPGMEAKSRAIRNHQAGLRELCGLDEAPGQGRIGIVLGEVESLIDHEWTAIDVASDVQPDESDSTAAANP